MELDAETVDTEAATLVTAVLRNGRATARRVRLENRLDGPVLPPRRNGDPEPGWDRDGVTAVVPPGERLALGYACPAEPTSPPVEIEWVGDADGTEQEAPVREAIRRLGDARPPRAVVGTAADPTESEATELPAVTAQSAGAERDETAPVCSSDDEVPLQEYRERIETVEALAAADVPTAADILESSGGRAGVEALGRRLDRDAGSLRALAARASTAAVRAEATTLAARAEAATPPTETLARLS